MKGVEKDRQERVLRWVAETLGISVAVSKQQSELRAPHGHSPTAKATNTHESPAQDIKSFVELKKPKNDTQFAAVVAYYYQFEAPESERKETITTDDLKDAARKAHWRQPPHPNATLNNAVVGGYLDRAARGSFCINTVGENLVAMTLPGDRGEQQRNPCVGRKRKTSRTRSARKAAAR